MRAENGDPELVEAIKHQHWRALESLTDRQRALCEIADKLSATPTKVVEGDWDALRELGMGDRDCLEVAHIIGLFNYLTRLADGMGLQLDAETVQAGETGTPLRRPTTP